MSWLEVYAVVVVHIGAIPATLFPIFYARSPWRSTDVGKALMTKGIAMALLFDATVANFWFGEFPGFEVLRPIIFTLVVVGITYQYLVMRSLQRSGRTTPTHDGDF